MPQGLGLLFGRGVSRARGWSYRKSFRDFSRCTATISDYLFFRSSRFAHRHTSLVRETLQGVFYLCTRMCLAPRRSTYVSHVPYVVTSSIPCGIKIARNVDSWSEVIWWSILSFFFYSHGKIDHVLELIHRRVRITEILYSNSNFSKLVKVLQLTKTNVANDSDKFFGKY